MNKVVVTNLIKSYGKMRILDEVSFAAKSGDVVAILGGSGGGKSTLLRCINLLEIPEQGEIQVNGVNLQFPCAQKRDFHQSIRSLRTRVGMVFQQFNLWPHMTVLGNLIEAPHRVLGHRRDELIKTAQVLLKKVGLEEKRDVYPTFLSGGQQQRVAIARALMMQPEVMLFDEPTSALDPEISREILAIMQQLAQEGMTMLIATHEIKFAREIASHVLFLDAGKVIEFGLAEEVLSAPKSERFRAFLESESRSSKC